MIIMLLISLVLLILVIPNLKVKKRIRPNAYTEWGEWEYLGRYKLKVWKYILLFIILLIPLANIVCSIIGFILLCVPTKCFENEGSEGWDLEETVIYLEWSNKISSFLNKEI